MRSRALRALAAALVPLLLVGLLAAERTRAQETPPGKESGYGETPEELRPFRGSSAPYWTYYREPPEFRGPGRERPAPTDVEEVRIGVLLPRSGIDRELGSQMHEGITLALEEANAEGGFRPGVPFVARVRDENLAWGGAANAVVDLVFDEGVWGIVGALEDSSTHVMARVLLKVETPLVNTYGSDPTLTEHAIPWLVRVRPDDRQSCYRLARRIFGQDGHERVVVLRSNDRYGRVGTRELIDAARRLHHPILLELRFENHDTSWDVQLERIRRARPQAIVLWGRAEPCGRVLRALRAAGLQQPVYGPDRLVDPAFLRAAGAAAEGTVFSYPFDPKAGGQAWAAFQERYAARFQSAPTAVAAYAYEGTRYLIAAIREAGLNRVRIRDRLFARKRIDGVMGPIRFDTTHNNVSAGVLGRVQNGKFELE